MAQLTQTKLRLIICLKHSHCVKGVCIRSCSGPYFPAFGLDTERYGVYGEIWGISPYSIRVRVNTDQNQNDFEYGHFSRSVH